MTELCPEHSWDLAFPPMEGYLEFPQNLSALGA
jgi:hypothetical protein